MNLLNIFKESFDLFKDNFKIIILLILIYEIPLSLIYTISNPETLNGILSLGTILTILTISLYHGNIIYYLHNKTSMHNISFIELIKLTVYFFPPLAISISIIYLLYFIGVNLFSETVSTEGIIFIFFVFLIPFLIILPKMFFVTPIIILENVKIFSISAFIKSNTLTKGYLPKIYGIYLIFAIIKLVMLHFFIETPDSYIIDYIVGFCESFILTIISITSYVLYMKLLLQNANSIQTDSPSIISSSDASLSVSDNNKSAISNNNSISDHNANNISNSLKINNINIEPYYDFIKKHIFLILALCLSAIGFIVLIKVFNLFTMPRYMRPNIGNYAKALVLIASLAGYMFKKYYDKN